MWVISVRGICALIGVFNNTGQTGESTIGIFVKTRINKRGREGFGTLGKDQISAGGRLEISVK